MVDEAGKNSVDRRRFLQAAAAAAVAAAATGTAAAIVREKKQDMLKVSPSVEVPQGKPSPATSDIATLRAQMAAVQADNERLQIRLAAAQGQLDLINRDKNVKGGSDLEAWQIQLDEANSQVTSLTGQVSLLSGLVALYEELDAIDLGTLASEGVNTVSSIFDGVMKEVPGVSEGIQAGQDALEELEEHIPALEAGHLWLQNQVSDLSKSFSAVEVALENVVDVAGTFLQKLNQWFQDILKWLPFGVGNKANSTLGVIATLLDAVPDTVDGIQTQVAEPLGFWLDKDGPETRLQQRIIRPVRNDALDKASLAVAQIQSLDSIYQSRLAEPVSEAVEKQSAIREQIVAYRQANLV